ncbi:MAG: ECF-type sigma factor [Schlesneria sp.]
MIPILEVLCVLAEARTMISDPDPNDPNKAQPTDAESLLPIVYDELRRLAAARLEHETLDQTLQATALVHEAYIRLTVQSPEQQWDHRGHFFAAAAESMRRILIDRSRNRRRRKRGGGGARREAIDCDAIGQEPQVERIVILNELIDKLAQIDPTAAKLVRLRVFAGFPHTEAANMMGITRRIADRHWEFARAWLTEALSDDSRKPAISRKNDGTCPGKCSDER